MDVNPSESSLYVPKLFTVLIIFGNVRKLFRMIIIVVYVPNLFRV